MDVCVLRYARLLPQPAPLESDHRDRRRKQQVYLGGIPTPPLRTSHRKQRALKATIYFFLFPKGFTTRFAAGLVFIPKGGSPVPVCFVVDSLIATRKSGGTFMLLMPSF